MIFPKPGPRQDRDWRAVERGWKQRIYELDHGHCRGCCGRYQLTAHHIHYRSQGGGYTDGNGILLCVKCHARVHMAGGREFMIQTLGKWRESADWRWGEAYDKLLKRRKER